MRRVAALVGRRLAIALVVLQLMVATNPVAAAVQSHPALNTIMAVANYGCVLFGAVALRAEAR